MTARPSLRPRTERLPFLREVTDGPLVDLVGLPVGRDGPTTRVHAAAAALGYRSRLVRVSALTPTYGCGVQTVIFGVREHRVVSAHVLRRLYPDEREAIEANFGLVHHATVAAMGYLRRLGRWRSRDERDCRSAGQCGAIRAVLLYDETRGATLSTYLYRAVVNTVIQEYHHLRKWRELPLDPKTFEYFPAAWGDPATDPAVSARLDAETDEPVGRLAREYVPSLTTRQLDVFLGHAGLKGDARPLIYYAQRYGISRERVRQINKWVRERLARAARRRHPDRYFDSYPETEKDDEE